MSEMAKSMLRSALDAFVERDVQLAKDVIDRDQAVDDLFSALFGELMEMVTDKMDVSGSHRPSTCFLLPATWKESPITLLISANVSSIW